MVKVTITMDTERETVTVSARMCLDAVEFIPQILSFIHQTEYDNKKLRRDV